MQDIHASSLHGPTIVEMVLLCSYPPTPLIIIDVQRLRKSHLIFKFLFVGLLTAVHKNYFTVLNVKDLLFNDFGDRVAQMLHIQLVKPFSQNLKTIVPPEIIVVNTHLLFPHDSSLSIARLNQVYTHLFILLI